jgi:Stage II sporulation protein E (SpoIIE)
MAAANTIAMVTSTLDGIRDANDAFLRLAGCTREDLTAGRVHWRLLTAPEWTSLDDGAVAELRATASFGPHLKEYQRGDGDVAGHDLAAAVAMGRLQLLLRYTALSGARPSEVLEALDQACPALTGTDFATVAYAEYDPAGPGGPTLMYACAGHPPPLLADGHTVRYLNEARSRPLGSGGARPQAGLTVPPAARLVLCTDGLVERRGRSIDDGFDRPARAVGELPAGDAAAACDRLLILMTHGDSIRDDIAVTCIDLNGQAARPLPPDAGRG